MPLVRIRNIRLPLSYTYDMLRYAAVQKLGVEARRVEGLRILHRAADARDKADVHFVLTVEARVAGAPPALRGDLDAAPEVPSFLPAPHTLARRPVVVGAGPAGLFAALHLARAGVRPILLERGREAARRRKDVERFWDGGALDPESNVQFGEGGAGAFSDGKLSTGTHDPRSYRVLADLVEAGAPPEILWEAKPHIGTDRLRGVVERLRDMILSLGGEVHFETLLTDIFSQNGALTGLGLAAPGGPAQLAADTLILAPGHSARDTFALLRDRGVALEQKPFAVGLRVEHLQAAIDRAQYGDFAGHPALGAADYRLSARLPDRRGVYTFCMCPGGLVVAAASEPGYLVTNGMSCHARDGVNANAAVLTGVGPADFPGRDPLAGVEYQRRMEAAAYALGGAYRAPAQRLGDFLDGRKTAAFGQIKPSYRPGVAPADLAACLPADVADALRAGLRLFDRRLRGYADPDAPLTGVETRSSSPLRIVRDGDCQSVSLRGLYPCGEGAGYAGGILSAAVDGLRCAQALLSAWGKAI